MCCNFEALFMQEELLLRISEKDNLVTKMMHLSSGNEAVRLTEAQVK